MSDNNKAIEASIVCLTKTVSYLEGIRSDVNNNPLLVSAGKIDERPSIYIRYAAESLNKTMDILKDIRDRQTTQELIETINKIEGASSKRILEILNQDENLSIEKAVEIYESEKH